MPILILVLLVVGFILLAKKDEPAHKASTALPPAQPQSTSPSQSVNDAKVVNDIILAQEREARNWVDMFTTNKDGAN